MKRNDKAIIESLKRKIKKLQNQVSLLEKDLKISYADKNRYFDLLQQQITRTINANVDIGVFGDQVRDLYITLTRVKNDIENTLNRVGQQCIDKVMEKDNTDEKK